MLYRPQRKVTFTRPKPFIGRKANLHPVDQSEPLHIGRNRRKGDECSGSERKRKREVGHIVGPDEQDDQEDVEYIADD